MFISVLKTLIEKGWQLVSEYFKSPEGKQGGFSKTLVLLFTGCVLTLLTFINQYLVEQARQNLDLQKDLVVQYNQLLQGLAQCDVRKKVLLDRLNTCESRSENVMDQCQEILNESIGNPNLIYDSELKKFVPRPIKN